MRYLSKSSAVFRDNVSVKMYDSMGSFSAFQASFVLHNHFLGPVDPDMWLFNVSDPDAQNHSTVWRSKLSPPTVRPSRNWVVVHTTNFREMPFYHRQFHRLMHSCCPAIMTSVMMYVHFVYYSKLRRSIMFGENKPLLGGGPRNQRGVESSKHTLATSTLLECTEASHTIARTYNIDREHST